MDRHGELGLGELLRHLTELVDGGSQRHYRAIGVSYRPRYTPVIRALGEGPLTVGQLRARMRVTQAAVSQTVKLLEAEGLVRREPTGDGRSHAVALTERGRMLRRDLVVQWALRLRVIEELEVEIGAPLRRLLVDAIDALEADGLDARLARAQAGAPQ
jgi:DNA-binding MarR family transcriptional regulator